MSYKPSDVLGEFLKDNPDKVFTKTKLCKILNLNYRVIYKAVIQLQARRMIDSVMKPDNKIYYFYREVR